MQYSEIVTLTTGTAGIFGTQRSFVDDGVYDPDFSGAGVYPFGYTTMASIYENYRVYGLTVDFLFTDPSADGMVVACLYQPAAVPTGLTSMSITAASSVPFGDVRPLNNTGRQTVRISRHFTIPQLQGMREIEWIANPNFEAQVGANPARLGLFNIGAASAAGTGGVTCQCLVRILYDVEWFGRKYL
jgi:hypothetical protein